MRWLPVLFCSTLFAQGSQPKAKPEDYETHGRAASAALGAEFMVHSFSGQGITYLVPDYLVVEVALYPQKGAEIAVEPFAFRLRLNGKKELWPVTAQMVVTSLQHPDWRNTPGYDVAVGTPEGGVVLSNPAPPAQTHPGPPPHTHPLPRPDEDPVAPGVTKEPRITAQQLVVETALPQGKTARPVSGFLYFPYQGKVSSLKAVELLFDDAVLKLR